MKDVTHLVVLERSELADLLDSLTPEQWRSPSLCEEWTVKDVAAHVVSYEERGAGDLTRCLASTPLKPWRLNEAALRDYAALPDGELAAFVRSHARPRGATARFGGRVGLTDAVIHHQDIRRPLGLPRAVPAERLCAALSFALVAPPLHGAWRVRGVRLVATDCDWTWGRGPEARGTGEAVLMTMAARRGVAAELSGPGAEVLRRRA